MPSVAVATPNHSSVWSAREKDLKQYLHFDRHLSRSKIERIANDPDAVAKNAFYPLIRFEESWTKFREKNQKLRVKKRPLRYASRRDAAIYARYRALLAELYEKELVARELEEVPIAYRKIPLPHGLSNKCNIDFAHDAFSKIRDIQECVVTVVDIRSYFESLDHDRIRDKWEMLLGKPMPKDHLAVFRALTKYSVVDIDLLFDRLGLYQPADCLDPNDLPLNCHPAAIRASAVSVTP